MRIPIVNKSIQQRLHSIGVQGENHVEEITFVLSRIYRAIDLSEGLAYIYISNAKKEVIAVKLDSEIELVEGKETDNLLLKWLIGSECTQAKGMLSVQLVINGLNDELWKSEISTFTVAQAIDYPTPLPVMYSNQSIRPILEEPDNEQPITISNRKFFIPGELKNIAVQNDENSEAVKVILPRYFDGQDLSKHTIALKTVSQGGRSDVVFSNDEKEVLEREIHLRWTLKPPETSYAGTLQLQLFVTGPGFKWETDVGEVNILSSLDADPVIPMTPSFVDEFLKNLQTYVNRAEEGASTATKQANIATNKAEEARESANQAEASKNVAVQQAQIATGQANIATEKAEAATQKANQAQLNAEQAIGSAQSAANSVELAQQIKDSTEVFYNIDEVGHRVGFRRANEQDFTYTPSLKGKQGEQGKPGKQGEKGEKGDRGSDAVAVETKGLFYFEVAEDGNLYVIYSDEDNPPQFSIDEEGYLYIDIE